MIIDSHIHLFPPEASESPARWAEQQGEQHWLNLMAPAKGKSLQDWPDLKRLIADMDEAGVDRGILQGWYWENPQSCELHNEFYWQCIQAYPDRLYATASFHPKVSDRPVEWLEKWLKRGFVGVGELLPPVQGMSWQDPVWGSVCELTTAHNLPLMFHITKPVGRDYPGKVPTPFRDVEHFLKQYPQQKVVLAHWGGLLPIYVLHPSFGPLLNRVYVDTAASPLLYRPEVFRWFPEVFDSGKILFGSDYPLRLYPSKQSAAEMGLFLKEVRQYLPECIQGKVLSDNVQSAYNLPLGVCEKI